LPTFGILILNVKLFCSPKKHYRMSYIETLAPMTDADRAFIRKQKNQILYLLVAAGVVFFGFAMAVHQLFDDWFVFIFLVLVLVVLTVFSRYMIRRSAKDLGREAMKRVIEGTIVGKREKSSVSRNSKRTGSGIDTDFFLVMEQGEIRVNDNYYWQFNTGDTIHIELTQATGVVLQATLIHDRVVEESTPEETVFAGYSETMSAEERAIIQKAVTRRALFTLLILAGVWAFLSIVLVVLGAMYFDPSNHLVGHVMAYGRYYFVGLLAVILSAKRIYPLVSDLFSYQKRVVPCTITDKVKSNVKLLGPNVRTSIQGDYSYLLIGEKLYEVSPPQFSSVEAGQRVRVHEGFRSGYFLGIDTNR